MIIETPEMYHQNLRNVRKFSSESAFNLLETVRQKLIWFYLNRKNQFKIRIAEIHKISSTDFVNFMR